MCVCVYETGVSISVSALGTGAATSCHLFYYPLEEKICVYCYFSINVNIFQLRRNCQTIKESLILYGPLFCMDVKLGR